MKTLLAVVMGFLSGVLLYFMVGLLILNPVLPQWWRRVHLACSHLGNERPTKRRRSESSIEHRFVPSVHVA